MATFSVIYHSYKAVSYTHLDVYKRQELGFKFVIIVDFMARGSPPIIIDLLEIFINQASYYICLLYTSRCV